MPAIVRGGKRQSQAQNTSMRGQNGVSSSADKTQPFKSNAQSQPKSRAKKTIGAGRVVIGKHQAIGAVSMSPEITGWLIAVLFIFLLTIVLFTGNRAASIATYFTHKLDASVASLGLKMNHFYIEGAQTKAKEDIKKALDFKVGQPFALMDLEAIKTKVKTVGWVKSVSVRRQFPDALVIQVTQKPTLAVWSNAGQFYVVDDQGLVIPEARANDYPQLPFVVGDGANENAGEIIGLVNLRPELMQRVHAFARIDTRRWDIVLKDNSVIKLPASALDKAFERLDYLMAKKHILDQGLAYIDMRDPESIAVIGWDKVEQGLQNAKNATVSNVLPNVTPDLRQATSPKPN